jgi:hypothetical protein
LPVSIRVRLSVLRLLVALAVFSFALPSEAMRDRRAVQGAARAFKPAEVVVGPAIPEPSSILLFVAGVAIVGIGIRRRRQ